MKKSLLAISLFLMQVSISGTSPQEVTTKVRVYDEIFLTDTGLVPLPENAIELAREFTIKSEQFKSPLKLATDKSGHLYASATNARIILKFDSAGEFLGPLGNKENGKPLFQAPYGLHAAHDYLVVQDRGRKSLEFVDYSGHHVRRLRIAELDDFAIGAQDRIYIAHYIQDKGAALITCYSPDGKSFSFGKPLTFHHSMPVLNSRSLAIDEKNELYVAFVYFPIVRKYSSEGKFLAEYKVESPVINAKEVYNLKIVGEGIANISQRVGFKALTISVKASGDRIYLLGQSPRLEITELDGQGKATATYWIDFNDIYEATDFAILDTKEGKRFYVAHSYPPHFDIDVFKVRERHGGLKEEVERLGEEIASYPNNSQSFINRGVARHQMGDYRGAVMDYSKAIELTPDSALAHNNRGLSRIKLMDLDEAIGDFSKAIELNPAGAGSRYNRGIAFALKKDYERAINDFERAADLDPAFLKKAQEQIAYCRALLKNEANKDRFGNWT
ncbi:MAG: tetratricopeptide repeat protein [Candidatus Aminicenantales bacterium]